MNALSMILIGFGIFFFFGATIGLLRFPDFYTRGHAAGKGDTLSTFMILLGFAIWHLQDLNIGTVTVALKLLIIIVFIFLTSPTATHALMRAGFIAGIKPWQKKQQTSNGDDQAA